MSCSKICQNWYAKLDRTSTHTWAAVKKSAHFTHTRPLAWEITGSDRFERAASGKLRAPPPLADRARKHLHVRTLQAGFRSLASSQRHWLQGSTSLQAASSSVCLGFTCYSKIWQGDIWFVGKIYEVVRISILYRKKYRMDFETNVESYLFLRNSYEMGHAIKYRGAPSFRWTFGPNERVEWDELRLTIEITCTS